MNNRNFGELRRDIIQSSVNRIKRFGFIHVNEVNIFEDDVYKRIFIRILLERLGENKDYDVVIKKMILEID